MLRRGREKMWLNRLVEGTYQWFYLPGEEETIQLVVQRSLAERLGALPVFKVFRESTK